MSRLLLIHWNADEAAERVERLRKAGYQADSHSDQYGPSLRVVREDPPDAFVIDLGRLPSHGRDTAGWLRQQKATRHVPIVFVGGDPEKVARVREALPDAQYASWRGIRGAVKRALAKPPADPIVPRPMEGYSGTPLPKKLGIKAGAVVALLGAPADFENTLGELPEDVRIKRQARGAADLIVLFCTSQREMRRRFPTAAKGLRETGSIWIAWPKKASGVATDLTQAEVRRFGLDAGFVDYKICAIDATWSGLLFTRRK